MQRRGAEQVFAVGVPLPCPRSTREETHAAEDRSLVNGAFGKRADRRHDFRVEASRQTSGVKGELRPLEAEEPHAVIDPPDTLEIRASFAR
jgi:hypothetical protein